MAVKTAKIFQVTLTSWDNLAGPPSWVWAAAWGELLAIFLSFSSLLVTATRYNQEPGPGSRQMFASLTLLASCLYRATIISVMVKLAPLLSCLLLTALTSLSAAALACWGGRALPSIWQAACSLLIPVGHSINTPILAKVPGGLPEAERSRINMEELLRKTRKVFALHSVVSLLLLVPYFTFLEVFLHPAPINYETSSALLSRPLTHSLPLLLLLLSLLSNVVYLHQAKLGRDAARAWNSLAQPPSPTPVSPACAPSLSPPPSPSRPMNAGDVLSAHISRGGGPPSPEAPSPLPPLVYPPLQPSAPLEEASSSRLPLPPGNRRCGHLDCVTCAFLQQGSGFISTVTKRRYKMMTPVTCTDARVIYLVTCGKCQKQYVGKTEQTLRQRHYGHRREIETLSSPLGRHFGEGCGYDNWQLQIIDRVGEGQSGQLGKREAHWQRELCTVGSQGLNSREERG